MDFRLEQQDFRDAVRRSIRNLGDHDAAVQFVTAYLDSCKGIDKRTAALALCRTVADHSIDYISDHSGVEVNKE